MNYNEGRNTVESA